MKTPSAESLLSDIRGKCLECCGGSRKLVDECYVRSCRLWKYRCMRVGIQTAMFGQEQLEGQMDMFEGSGG